MAASSRARASSGSRPASACRTRACQTACRSSGRSGWMPGRSSKPWAPATSTPRATQSPTNWVMKRGLPAVRPSTRRARSPLRCSSSSIRRLRQPGPGTDLQALGARPLQQALHQLALQAGHRTLGRSAAAGWRRAGRPSGAGLAGQRPGPRCPSAHPPNVGSRGVLWMPGRECGPAPHSARWPPRSARCRPLPAGPAGRGCLRR